MQTGPLGVVVTDGTGQLIYRFDRDGNAPPTSNCTGDCTATWQPVKADLDKPPVLLGVDEDQVGVVTRADGTDQLTLAGWPLYRHLGDARRRRARRPTAPTASGSPSARTASKAALTAGLTAPMSRSPAAVPSYRATGRNDRGGRHGTHSRGAGGSRPAWLGRLLYRLTERRLRRGAGAVRGAWRHHPRLLRAGLRRRGGVRAGRPPAAAEPARAGGVPGGDRGGLLVVRGLRHHAAAPGRARRGPAGRTSTTTRPARTTPSWNGAALAYADAMTAQPMAVTDAPGGRRWRRRSAGPGLIELTHAIALENMRARFNHALGHHRPGLRRGLPRSPGSDPAARRSRDTRAGSRPSRSRRRTAGPCSSPRRGRRGWGSRR